MNIYTAIMALVQLFCSKRAEAPLEIPAEDPPEISDEEKALRDEKDGIFRSDRWLLFYP